MNSFDEHEDYSVVFSHFEEQDLDVFQMRAHEAELVSREKILQMESRLLTVWVDGKVLCLCGNLPLWEGVTEAFLLPSVLVPKYKKTFFRNTLMYLQGLQQQYRRIQTFSKADQQTDNWMRHLGFRAEGTLNKYTAKGDDYRMWARLRNGS